MPAALICSNEQFGIKKLISPNILLARNVWSLLSSITIMIRSALPITHLAEPGFNQKARKASPSHGLDAVFVISTGLLMLGGAAFLLDAGSSHQEGHSSVLLQMASETLSSLPSLMAATSKYILLFLASIVNSALIALGVQALRVMDRHYSRLAPRLGFRRKPTSGKIENVRGKRAHLESQRATQRRQEAAIRTSSPFLLSPLLR